MTTYTTPLPKVLEIFLELANYPIRSVRIRERMREELFNRGVIGRDLFEKEVEDKAVLSQHREGLTDPYTEETAETWEQRKGQIRDYLTDFYFAYNLPHRLLTQIVQQELGGSRAEASLELYFNPELAPWDLLFAQARKYEALPADQRASVQHHLQEILVVLIKAMISDQLSFIAVAKEHFRIADLEEIRRRRIGRGKIGGKAAGLMLAWNILRLKAQEDGIDLAQQVVIPESFFVGSDVFYEFLEINGLLDVLNQKYKSVQEIVADYDDLPARFIGGRFPDAVVEELRRLLQEVGPVPLIVRSSSLLEDNFATAFAGKYESVFCPNQGTLEENLQELMVAISKVYASVLNPDALLYRQQMGLVDYDERMAILIQELQGEAYRGFFFPTLAGVGFSRNPFLWTLRLRRQDGFVRLVTGLGTRAVDRVPDDYPRMIGLSHPSLRPEQEAYKIRHYSQHFMDVVDLAANRVSTLPVSQVLDQGYPWLRLLTSIYRGTYLEPIISAATRVKPEELVLTLDGLLRHTDFVARIQRILRVLEGAYNWPVDVEFTVGLQGSRRRPELVLHLLQCRPQSSHEEGQAIQVPKDVPEGDILFTANYLIPNGIADRVRYVVYVDPVRFSHLTQPAHKLEIARVLGRLNQALQHERFILIGPGRWGSSNPDLGVKVTYADVFNSCMLVEIGLDRGGGSPEVSHGTHFFQDLVESRIYPLAVFPDQPGIRFNGDFLEHSPNRLVEISPIDASWEDVVRVIEVPAVRDGQLLEVVMSAEEGQALAYFRWYE